MDVIRVSEYVAPSPGGKEVHVRELSRWQTRHGHSVRLIYRVGGEIDLPFEATPVLGNGKMLRHLPRRVVSGLFLLAALAQVAKHRRTANIIHFHGDYLEAVASGAIRLLGIPSLLTLHGRLSPRVLRTIGFAYRLPSHIVAVSPAIIAQLDTVGIPRRKMTVQPSGVDSEIFYPPRHAPEMPPFRVVVGSTLIRLKDHPTLFEAVRLLQAGGLDIRLEVAGDGPERARLESLAPPRTSFRGQLERSKLGHQLRQCHVAALASVDAPGAGEGTPTFLMEAVACGLPFVATDTGGVSRLASRSGAGLVVPPQDPDSFAAALRRLAEDKRLHKACRNAAIAFAPNLDWDLVAQRLDSLMRTLITGRSGLHPAQSERRHR